MLAHHMPAVRGVSIRLRRIFCWLLLAFAPLPPARLASQLPLDGGRAGGGSPAAARRVHSLPATRLADAPRIDGRLDEPAWQAAPAATDFVQRRPDTGAAASQRSEARVLLDDGALYVGMRLFDTAPDSVAATLGRRDFTGFSDWAQVIVDSYHDRRTGFRFGVNPAGVKTDAYLSGDDEWHEDRGWDAVWEAAATRDSLGWSAEMRIPLSQLRFSAAEGKGSAWGIQFVRDLARRGERSLWAPAPPEAGGFVSHFGELRDVRVSPARRLEVVPYLVGRLARSPGDAADPFHDPSRWLGSLGADARAGLTSYLTLSVTLNPDFGQVEADPSEVNLTGAETFLSERRPFFLEGGDIFRLGMAEVGWIHPSEELFYSRRIGRAPRGSAPRQAVFAEAPQLTTLLGAAKLSGKTAAGWSVGLLNAVTAEERARYVAGDGTRRSVAVEPLTSHTVGRLMRDFREGRSALGAAFTATQRRLDPELDFLPSSALVGALDGRHRLGNGEWELAAQLLGSRVAGAPEAVDRVARGPVHRQQRPDAEHIEYDPTRTSLSGLSATVRLQKLAGGHWRGGLAGHAVTPGFEANDLGYHTASDFRRVHAWIGYDQFRSGPRLNRWATWLNVWSAWSFGEERIATGAEAFAQAVFPNLWSAWGSVRRELPALDPAALRGGPGLYRPGRTSGTLGLQTDRRRPLSIELQNGYLLSDDGGRYLRTAPGVTIRPSGRVELTASPALAWTRHPSQWVGSARTGDTIRYLVGGLSQTTASLTTRLSYTFTPGLSLQLYAQPFLSGGRFTRLREVADAGAAAFGDRFRTLVPGQLRMGAPGDDVAVDRDGDGRVDFAIEDPDFSVGKLNSNLVLRWEYRPGSAFFVVWSHGRSAEGVGGSFDLRRDAAGLLELPASNVLVLKWSHWLGK